MATTAPSPPPAGSPLPMPSRPHRPSTRTPLPLSAGQEQQVRDIYYKRVRSYCAEEIKVFAACALGRTFTATFACRKENLAMNTCMVAHATMEEQDRAREEWFAGADDRIRQKQEKEAKRIAQEKFHKEWWGIDEQGRIGVKAKDGGLLRDEVERGERLVGGKYDAQGKEGLKKR